MHTSKYQDSFSFRQARPYVASDKDRKQAASCRRTRHIYRRMIVEEIGSGNYINITWYGPKIFRNGMERVYCTFHYGNKYQADIALVSDYSGGTGHSKYLASFYSCLYKLGLDLYKDDKHQTGQFAPSDVLPALIRHLFGITDLTNWHTHEI